MSFHPRFPLEVLTFSETAARKGIDNAVPTPLIANGERLSLTLGELEESLSEEFPGCRLYVSSAYRSPQLNAAVGGSAPSDHSMFLAADFTASNISVALLAQAVKSRMTDYNQIIIEFGKWVHLALMPENRAARNEDLTAIKRMNSQGKLKTVYLQGFVENA